MNKSPQSDHTTLRNSRPSPCLTFWTPKCKWCEPLNSRLIWSSCRYTFLCRPRTWSFLHQRASQDFKMKSLSASRSALCILHSNQPPLTSPFLFAFYFLFQDIKIDFNWFPGEAFLCNLNWSAFVAPKKKTTWVCELISVPTTWATAHKPLSRSENKVGCRSRLLISGAEGMRGSRNIKASPLSHYLHKKPSRLIFCPFPTHLGSGKRSGWIDQ